MLRADDVEERLSFSRFLSSLGVASLPGRVSVGITVVSKTAVSVISVISVISAIVSSKAGVIFRVDDRLRDGHGHVFDNRDGVGLRHLNGVWGGNWDLDWDADGNGHGAVYWDRNMLGDLDWVGFGHLDGVRAVDGHGVRHLEKKNRMYL